jgi:LCP family protein required for cell wall assembly
VSELVANSSSETDIQNPADSVKPTAEPSSLLSQIAGLFRKPAAAGEPQCNGPSSMTILLIGSDERADDYLYGLADSIRLVRIDFVTSKVMILDIPRDLWVEIPDISDHYGITHGKINQAYFFGNPGMGYYDGPGEGPGLLARTLDLNFGLRVDRYLAVDMTTFVAVIDAIGGIDIHLDSTIDLNMGQDGANPDLVLEAGEHHLDGNQALLLAVNRQISIFQRAEFQNIVLSALQDKLLSPAIIPALPQLISQFSKSVQTDLSPLDINHLVCIGQALTRENTSIVAFPEEMFTGESTYDPYRQVNTYTMAADFNQLRAYFADFMNGTWP